MYQKVYKIIHRELEIYKSKKLFSIKSSKLDICKVVFSKITKLSDQNNLFAYKSENH
jgi:hypothetical protein